MIRTNVEKKQDIVSGWMKSEVKFALFLDAVIIEALTLFILFYMNAMDAKNENLVVYVCIFIGISIICIGITQSYNFRFVQRKTKTAKNIAKLALREYIPFKEMCRKINECINTHTLYKNGDQYITRYGLFLYNNRFWDSAIVPILLKDIALVEVKKGECPDEMNNIRIYTNDGKIYNLAIHLNEYETNQIVKYIQMEKKRNVEI